MSMLEDRPVPAGSAAHTTTRLVIPGAGTLELVRRPDGALARISGGGVHYLDVDPAGVWHWHGVCRVSERRAAGGISRTVDHAGGRWTEEYRWEDGRLTEVDGVVIRRDEAGRIVACVPGGHDPAPPDHRWFYTQGDRGVTHITGPFGHRHLALDEQGRAVRLDEDGVERRFAHTPEGVRLGPGRPLDDHVDEAGRCWATVGTGGRVEHVFIWDGTRCLARIDGVVGDGLGAVFSLDPSGTPVRVVTPREVRRIPRDAYGEGLLAVPGVPGLFGGQVADRLVHLPLRRLDPAAAVFCEPDPCDGGDGDPRRVGAAGWSYEGPLPAEAEPRSAFEVCRGDPIGRSDPSGGVSAGLIISDLTWSFQNNILSFFGIDWWFNLFASLICAPGLGSKYDFFDSAGLSGSEGHGGFGLRRGGIIDHITGGRAFTTQHIVWSPDNEYADLEHGEVISASRAIALSHYGSILAFAPEGKPRRLLESMSPAGRNWIPATSALLRWTRHGGTGVPVAPGTLTPHLPDGGLHLDAGQTDLRRDVAGQLSELQPGPAAVGTLEDRSFLTVAVPGVTAGDTVLVDDGTALAIAPVVAVVNAGTTPRIQLGVDLGPMGTTGLTVTEVAAAALPSGVAAPPSHNPGAVADSLDVHGTTVTYAAGDLLRLTAGAAAPLVARVARLEARIPLDRPLPAALAGPIRVLRGSVAASALTVTMAGSDLDFGSSPRPAVGTTGVVSGGGVDVAVRIEAHTGASAASVDTALPAALTGAGAITFRTVTAATLLGVRSGGAEAGAVVTYEPTVAGSAPDGSTGLTVVRCESGAVAHARLVTGAPVHDVIVLDRALGGAGPFTAERFTTTGPAVGHATRADVVGLVVPDPARFSDASAVYLAKVTGRPPVAGPVLLAGVAVANGVISATPAAGAPSIEPGRPVLVTPSAGAPQVAAIRTVRVTVTLTDAADLDATGLRVVELQGSGYHYGATLRRPDQVLVLPQISLASTTVEVPFPRFAAGDLVRISAPGGGNESWHRIATADGGLLTLVPGSAVHAAGPDLEVQAVETVDPGTGGPFLGIDGTRTGTGPTTTATFSAWAHGAFPAGRPIGVISGGVTHPTTVAAGPQPVEVTLGEAITATAASVARLDHVRVGADPVARFAPAVARDAGVLLLDGGAGNLATAAGESLVAVAYQLPAGATPVACTIGPGSLLVPEREKVEVSRSQSLTDHELTHTLQYAKWGPLWFCAFPMLAMELPGILATDTELPEYSRFLTGTAEVGTASRWNITLGDLGGVALGQGDEVQIVQGSQRRTAEVVGVVGTSVEVKPTGSGPSLTGAVSLRKKQKASAFDVAYSILDLLTHGGLVNMLAGTTWGGIFWLLGKGFYGLGRAIAGTGDLFAATVQAGGGAVTLAKEADANHFQTSGRIVVRQGQTTLVRTMNRSGAVITLDQNVALTGDVRVAPYDTHDAGSAFDWYDYYPATVDTANPFVVDVAAVGSSSLSLHPEDRVIVLYRDTSTRCDVLAVNGTRVELSAPVTVVGAETSVRIARIGTADPLGNIDEAAMIEMGMGWMKWVFDPYGQIEYAVSPRQEWARWLLRVMRWVMGTQNFSLLPFGYLWWFRLFPTAPEHVRPIEQEASQNSGDLYSPLGRIYGEVTGDGFGVRSMVVGDIARYRYWPINRYGTFVEKGRLDQPGIPYRQQLVTMPDRITSGGSGVAPNGFVRSDPASVEPGRAVAEVFTEPRTDPRPVPAATGTFGMGPLGHVPVAARIERTMSHYVSFTRPGTHRVTTEDGIQSAQDAVDAFNLQRQTLFFDVTVGDVTVTAAGRTVNATPPGGAHDVLTLVPFQRVPVAVTPNGSRQYRLTVADSAGPVRVEGAAALVAVAASASAVPVEVSRLHAVAAGRYASGGLAAAGMHLSRDVHIPVRRFLVSVVDQLPLLATADPATGPRATLARGTSGFILVPAPIVRPPTVTTIAGVPPAAGTPSPFTRVTAPPAAATAFLGPAGSAFGVAFPPTSPTGDVVITIQVGDGASPAVDLTCRFTLT